MRKRKYNVLDLFAGCGGMSKGFEQAGFDIVAANEFWKPAQKTYKINHQNTQFFYGDITNQKTKNKIFDFFKDKKCDVIVGGPPCQAYSTSGLRNPDDPRGKLFEDYVEIVKNLKPDIFVMENVKGILTMMHDREDLDFEDLDEYKKLKELEKESASLALLRKKSKNNPERFKFGKEEESRLRDVKQKLRKLDKLMNKYREPVTSLILRKFSNIGYKVRYKLLNSADFGVPQKRQRVIFIGTKHKISLTHPYPTHTDTKTGPQKTFTGKTLLPWVSVREAIDDLKGKKEDEESSHIYTFHNDEFKNKISNTPIGKSVFGGYSDSFYRNSPDEPARTVKENHGGVLVHYEKDRVMTPRELARLQSFPDDFKFLGSKSNILKQIGNAVPPGLGKAIGLHILKMLEEIYNQKNIQLKEVEISPTLTTIRPNLLIDSKSQKAFQVTKEN